MTKEELIEASERIYESAEADDRDGYLRQHSLRCYDAGYHASESATLRQTMANDTLCECGHAENVHFRSHLGCHEANCDCTGYQPEKDASPEPKCGNCGQVRKDHGDQRPFRCNSQSWSNWYEFAKPKDALPTPERESGAASRLERAKALLVNVGAEELDTPQRQQSQINEVLEFATIEVQAREREIAEELKQMWYRGSLMVKFEQYIARLRGSEGE